MTESTPIVSAIANVSITEANYITCLKAGFNNTPAENYTDVLADLRSDGSFTFNRTRLDTIYGSSLPDGHHTLHLLAIDKYGVSSNFNISFTLDTSTAVPILNLSASSDSGKSNSDRNKVKQSQNLCDCFTSLPMTTNHQNLISERLINVDVNSYSNVIKKTIPNTFSDRIKGLVVHPVRLNLQTN
ncbi:hypothetical protein JYQ62_16785 [Nostoc sp. UHCC 0702]|nr:hypothetical protein JYQ62_16785 [Nostoc sp. UHCC 0702]